MSIQIPRQPRTCPPCPTRVCAECAGVKPTTAFAEGQAEGEGRCDECASMGGVTNRLGDLVMAQHGGACSCPDCGHRAVAGEPMAMYRVMNGRSVFMGIVQRGVPNALVKLDDPRGELDGPGHVMCETEFLAECALYDDSSLPRTLEVEPVCMINKIPAAERILPPAEARDAFFPFDHRADGTLVARVRSDDRVYVLHEYLVETTDDRGETAAAPRRESFWCHVISVTTATDSPLITAVPTCDLDWIDPGEPIVFKACCVLAMRKGEHWHTDASE